MGDGPARMAGPRVVADEQRDIEPGSAAPSTIDHAFWPWRTRARRVDPVGQQVVHPAVAVVDEDVVGAGRQRALDGGVRLADHQLDGGRVAVVAGVRRVRVVDPGDPLHVDAQM